VLLTGSVYSKSLNFSTIKKIYGLSEAIQLKITSDQESIFEEDFSKIPGIENFEITQSLGRSSSISIINGERTSSYSMSLLLYAKKVGEFQIGPLSQGFKSNSLTLKIVAQAPPSSLPSSPSTSQNAEEDFFETEESDSSSFETPSEEGQGQPFLVDSVVDKKQVYLNEQLVYTFRFLTRGGVEELLPELPEFEDFWKIPFGDSKKEKRIINGQEWFVIEVSYALFPKKTGKLIISGVGGQAVVRSAPRRMQISPFGMGGNLGSMMGKMLSQHFGEAKAYRLKTEEIAIEVLPLPSQEGEEYSTALVGETTAKAFWSNPQVKTGDSVTLTIEVEGESFTQDVTANKIMPEISLQNFKIYDDRPQFSSQEVKGKLKTKTILSKTLIPLIAGEFQLGPVVISFFNPREKNFKKISLPLDVLKVTGEAIQTVSNEPPVMAEDSKKEVITEEIFLGPMIDSGFFSRFLSRFLTSFERSLAAFFLIFCGICFYGIALLRFKKSKSPLKKKTTQKELEEYLKLPIEEISLEKLALRVEAFREEYKLSGVWEEYAQHLNISAFSDQEEESLSPKQQLIEEGKVLLKNFKG